MSFKSVAIVAFLGGTYVLLFLLFMPYILPLERPSWWYDIFGQSSFSALLWPQLVHSLSVLGAAIPVAIGIVFQFPDKRYLIVFIAASFLAVFLLVDIIQGYWLYDAPYSGFYAASHSLDVVKVFLILFMVVYLIASVKPANKNQ